MAAADLDYAKVTGRLGITEADGPDLDDDPEIVWCDEGTVRFTPLQTITKVAGAAEGPFTAGHSIIEADIDGEGYLTHRGKRFVWVIDLTSDKVNPKIGPNKATHRVEFLNVKANGVKVSFPNDTVRLTKLGPDGDGVNDLTSLMTVQPGAATAIFRGEKGTGIAALEIVDGDQLQVELTDGTIEVAGTLPAGPGGSNAGVAGYIETDGPTKTALLASNGPISTKVSDDLADRATPIGQTLMRGGRCWVILGTGQSNNTTADLAFMPAVSDPRLCKYTAQAGITVMSENEINMTTEFARNLLRIIPVTDWVLVVPAAVGATCFTEVTSTVDGQSVTCSWDRTNTTAAVNLYNRAVAWAQGAAAAATALGAVPFFSAITFSGFEGETPNMNEATFTSKLVDMFTHLRTDLGASTVPIVLGSLVPEYADLRGNTYTADIARALTKIPSSTSLSMTAFFYGPRGFAKPGEVIHYSALGQIERGKMAFDAWQRAFRNRGTINPQPPPNVRVVREPGRAFLRWDAPVGRFTSLTAEFSIDGGLTWQAGTVDNDSRLFATIGIWPWQSVQGRVRVTNAGAAIPESDWGASNVLAAIEAIPVGVTVIAQDGGGTKTISPTHTGAGTLYAAFRLPASGGSAAANARNADSSRTFLLTAQQAGSIDIAQAKNANATLTATFPAPKAVAGMHVSAASWTADGGTLVGYRDHDTPVSTTGTTGAIEMTTLATSGTGGAEMLGAVLFAGAVHDATTVARYREVIANRYGAPVT